MWQLCLTHRKQANKHVPNMLISVFDRIEKNIGEKGDNAGYQNFLFFPTMFLTHSHTMTPFDAPVKQAL